MQGFKIYKIYSNVKLIENGFNSYNLKNTRLGQLIKQAKAELKNCVVWYKVVNKQAGVVYIIYKEV